MKIADITGIPYRLPLTSALAWGTSSALSAAEHVLVKVTLEDGCVGLAEATPRPTIYGETTQSVLGILRHLKSVLVGLDIHDTVAINHARNSVKNNHTARGALDMAVWEARAKALGQSLFDMLMGPQQRVRVSFILGIADSADMLAEAERVVEAGVRCLKVKVGRNHQKDLAVIADLQRAFGKEVLLYADSNETLTMQTAAEALPAMREAGLMYVEEPLPACQLGNRAKLHQQGLLPIVADDSCFTLPDLERELEFDTFDVLNVKTARNGFTDGLQMLEKAASADKRGMVGSQASTGVGTVHAALLSTQAAVTEPCELSFVLKLKDDLLGTPIEFKEGWLDVASLQEHVIDEQKLAQYRI